MASVASYEGYSGTLHRWKNEHTAPLSHGNNKGTNLEKSILISLTSPRMASTPDAKQLLSLLSLLPDGITDRDLIASNISIPRILAAKSLLLRTSLAQVDHGGRLKVLSPIREYISTFYPAHEDLIRPLRNYWQDLLKLWYSQKGNVSSDIFPQLTNNVGNIESLLLHGLTKEQDVESSTLISIVDLNFFSQSMLKGVISLATLLPAHIKSSGDKKVQFRYILSCLGGSGSPMSSSEVEECIPQMTQYLESETRLSDKVDFFVALALQFSRTKSAQRAVAYTDLALALVSEAASTQGYSVGRLFELRSRIEADAGNYQSSIDYAQRGQQASRHSGEPMGELSCLLQEATACAHLGNFSLALQLCDSAYELIVSSGMQNSVREILLLDLEASIAFSKREYSKARTLYGRMKTKTKRSLRFQTFASLQIMEINMLLDDEDSDIDQMLKDAWETSVQLEWNEDLTETQAKWREYFAVSKLWVTSL
ncbi:NB-ARC domain-containing protein [Mycena venus]|uniref:NB-ARC domain-containing protein n=1 Tax=Mycena venus TaxID=2733690 RepID=A0A8H6YWK4_9AGAR|nr:NB-ARC domain-containing protein [Mycena venus]